MYIAMNRFKVLRGMEDEFEAVWQNRKRRLDGVLGYLEFHMLKSEPAEGHTLYASHTVWETKEHFVAWTKSDAFAQAHKGAGARKKMYLEGPHFEGFAVIIHEQQPQRAGV